MSETLGRMLVDEVGRFRKALVKRIRRVNQLTEGEVMSAASGLGKIVDLATQLSSHTKETLAGVAGDEAEEQMSLTDSIANQSNTTEDFINGLNSKIGQQREVAARAHQQSRDILRAAKSVERLSQQSNIIALNAMVEAARMGKHGTSFSVISNEMQRLSGEIKKTNTMVSALAEDLSILLPAIAQMIEQTSDHAEDFSGVIKDSITDVRQRTSDLQRGVATLLTSNEDSVQKILRESQDALSYLQFQDTVAQGLLRMDSMARKLQVRVGTMGGEEMEDSEAMKTLAKEEHAEIGGEKEISPDDAGDVMLF
ncbi:MAG: hypothetical protein GY811_26630 [Myxococcales bacterium]|nr:hypothetical protein [Myxococcales bacterium]